MPKREYVFTVKGTPPKNARKGSMWNDSTEAFNLIELRKRAFEALGDSELLSENIELSVKVHLPKDCNSAGDLDNFVKGICDGLSSYKSIENPNHKIDAMFEEPEYCDIHPKTFAMIEDDENITKITAIKSLEEIEEPFYEITLYSDR
ncbi:MAG: hypothetical protein SVM80_00440 [Halobacteriota archaeon]|nr:hypothetical protein [Halobacteriota archaeon]